MHSLVAKHINQAEPKRLDLIILNLKYNVNPLLSSKIIEKRIYMKKILKDLELKKFNKLARKENIIPVTRGNELLYLLDVVTGKEYHPEFSGLVVA